MISLLHLLLLLGFFGLLGLSVASTKVVKERFALLPALGLSALVGGAYVLSANFRLSGAMAMGVTTILLLLCALFRSPMLCAALRTSGKNGEIKRSLLLALVPICTLILPALFYGFNFFYGSVNFDFFYNSQESWFLKTHNVLQFASAKGEEILPLSWSSNFQGRFAISLVAAFFSSWLPVDALQFNSLLLNTLVVIFALAVSVFCQEFFRFSNRKLFLAVFFTVLSAGYVQSYSYYLLGQLSAIPPFIVYCIVLKSLLEKIQSKNQESILGLMLGLAALFNVLYVFYAILSFFALILTVVSACFYGYKHSKKSTAIALGLTLLFAVTIFAVIRLSAVSESIHIIKEWTATSTKVAAGGSAVIVFSEYLKDAFLALLFGTVNYPSSVSVFGLFINTAPIRNLLLFFIGLGALTTLLLSLKVYLKSKDVPKSAHAIILALTCIILACAFYFFLTLASYALFKIQSWFMPLLVPLYLYAFDKKISIGNRQLSLSLFCGLLLALNLSASVVYMGDFLASDKFKRYANVRGVTGSKDITDLATVLNNANIQSMSLLLNNGIEAAWVANFTRGIELQAVTHNFQPLADKDLPAKPCTNLPELNANGPWVLTHPNSIRSDVTDFAQGGKVIYENNSYSVIDPKTVATYAYFGRGAYPVELNLGRNTTFPKKFRWVSRGVEIIIYSNEARKANLLVEVVPGYVVTKDPVRHFSITTDTNRYDFSAKSQIEFVVPQVSLRKGLTCVFLESPDEVTSSGTQYSIWRRNIPLDTRLTNFAVSRVSIQF